MQLPLLVDISIILGLSVLVVLIFQWLRIPTVIGFLITGIIAGPHLLSLIDATHEIEVLAEIGVIMLLFIVGLEFSISSLLAIKRFVLIGGGVQVFLTVGVVYFISTQLGFSTGEAVFLGFLFSLSSTAIVLKLLQQRNEIDSVHGKTILAILIFQDIIVVPMMLFVPILAGDATNVGLSLLTLALKGLAVIALVVVLARYIMPRFLYLIVKTGSKELFIMCIVATCFAVAWLTSSLGLSLALGAFLAGLIISESEYSHQAISNILPFHEIFTSFFFVSIGMLLDVQFLVNNITPVLFFTLLTMITKTAIASIAAMLLKLPLRLVVIIGLSLCQVGEFAFILSMTGMSAGVLDPETYQYFLSVSILTMGITPFIIMSTGKISVLVGGLPLPAGIKKYLGEDFSDKELSLQKEKLNDHLIIIGFGLNGRNLAHAAREARINYVILELNAETVKREKNDEPIIYGDAVQSAVLEHLNVEKARVVVIAISDPVATRRIVANIRSLSPKTYIIVRTRYLQEMKELYSIGANEVIPEEFETSIEIFTRVLTKYLVPKDQIENFIVKVRADGYDILRGVSVPSASATDLPLNLSGIEVSSYQLEKNSPFAGKTMAENQFRNKYGITVIAVQSDGEMLINPGSDIVLKHNDILYTIGKPEDLASFYNYIGGSQKEDAE